MSAETVTLERRGEHVALVTLNRPEARNAINGAVARELGAIVEQTEVDPDIWVVVLTGSGEGVFCAGADLKEIAEGRGAELSTRAGGFAGYVFARREKPWIAAVNGLALAGGCEIALASDLIVAEEGGAFGLPEVQRGLAALAGGLFRLPRLLPRNVALELIATGDRLPSERAHALGLVNCLAARGKAVEAALTLAARIAANAPIAVRESLQIARQSANPDDVLLRKLGNEAWERISATEDFREGPRAFIEKRAPRWVGR